jgi:uncharacterized protein YndB with AHSA1/START domain
MSTTRGDRIAAIDTTPIHKEIVIERGASDVFDLFTRRVGSWWPILTHSIGADRVVEVIHEAREGGRLYERLDDGTEYAWGRILVWEPPRRVVYAWDPSPEPRTPTEVELRFIEDGPQRTVLHLEHRGWDAIGERAREGRPDYDVGWDVVRSGGPGVPAGEPAGPAVRDPGLVPKPSGAVPG